MKDLISREALIKRLEKVCITDDGFGMGVQFGIDCAKDFVAEAPAVDAVPVIRCKNCKHYNLQALACTHDNFNGTIGMDGFCSYGELRGERKKPPETEGKG